MVTRKLQLTFVVIALFVVVTSTVTYAVWQTQLAQPQSHVLYQIAPYNTFIEGNYDGNTTFAQLEQHGDFGMGTLEGLNGEMVALDGTFYQIPSSGVPRKIDPSETTPYATVTFFKTTQTIQIPSSTTYQQLVTTINQSLPNPDAIYAIKVHGTYDYAKTRAPQLQEKPYPNVTQALLTQSVFNLTNVDGTIVGFYFPNSMNGVDYAGYHFHFITDDRTAGGHLLDCTIANATIELDQINIYTLVIP